MNQNLVSKLVSEYIADPNCWPALWIAGENVTPEEKQKFLSMVKDHQDFDKYLDSCEKSHP